MINCGLFCVHVKDGFPLQQFFFRFRFPAVYYRQKSPKIYEKTPEKFQYLTIKHKLLISHTWVTVSHLYRPTSVTDYATTHPELHIYLEVAGN